MKRTRILIHAEDWTANPTMLYFWVNLLFMADENGVVETSLSKLASEMHLSVRQIRTCMERTLNDKRVTHEATKQGTKITICDFDSYSDSRQSDRQSERQTSDTPIDTQKEGALCGPGGYSPSFTPYNPPQENKESSVTDVPEDKKRDKPVSGPSDFSFVLDLWNSYAKRNVPKIKAITPARRDKVKLRIAEMGGVEKAKEILAECFKKISESDFCNGATGKWAANFDWFFSNEKNWLKVLEGNYDNRKEKSELEKLAELYQKGHEYYGQRYGYGGASAYGNPAGGREDGPDDQ